MLFINLSIANQQSMDFWIIFISYQVSRKGDIMTVKGYWMGSADQLIWRRSWNIFMEKPTRVSLVLSQLFSLVVIALAI